MKVCRTARALRRYATKSDLSRQASRGSDNFVTIVAVTTLPDRIPCDGECDSDDVCWVKAWFALFGSNSRGWIFFTSRSFITGRRHSSAPQASRANSLLSPSASCRARQQGPRLDAGLLAFSQAAPLGQRGARGRALCVEASRWRAEFRLSNDTRTHQSTRAVLLMATPQRAARP